MATSTLQVQSQDWDSAFIGYQSVMARLDRLLTQQREAEEKAGRECPRVAHFFDVYRLGIGMTRERVLEALRRHAYTSKSSVNEKQVANEFMAFQAKWHEARQRHGLDEIQSQIDELNESWSESRELLMSMPAPDHAGLLAKIEIAFATLNNDDADEALLDAKRILGGKA